nr:MAG TPA: hypothetical protein [Caudoviricetes sp.]
MYIIEKSDFIYASMHQIDLQAVTTHRCQFSSMHIDARQLQLADLQRITSHR